MAAASANVVVLADHLSYLTLPEQGIDLSKPIDLKSHATTTSLKQLRSAAIERAFGGARDSYRFHPDAVGMLTFEGNVTDFSDSTKLATLRAKQPQQDPVQLRLVPKRGIPDRSFKGVLIDDIATIFVVNENATVSDVLKFARKHAGLRVTVVSVRGGREDAPPCSMDATIVSIAGGAHHLSLVTTTATPSVAVAAVPPAPPEVPSAPRGGAKCSVYLIRTREFLTREVFKIGKTTNPIDRRLGAYGKGGEVLLTIGNIDASAIDSIERKIIETFAAKFTPLSEIGAEYFEGDLVEMQRGMLSLTGLSAAADPPAAVARQRADDIDWIFGTTTSA